MVSHPTQPLSEVADLFSGGTPSKAVERFWGGPIPWLTPKDMALFTGFTESTVTPNAIGNGTRLAPAGAIFIAVRGMSLHNEIRIIQSEQPITFNQDIKAIVPHAVNGRFLFYALSARKPDLLSYVESAGHGTGRLPTDKLLGLAIPAMTQAEQDAISSTLGTIDEKIDLNRRMNETLKAMAQTIFKDWFIDFGPTRAKAEGRPPYLAPELWTLFPATLDDDDKPLGWHRGKLSDVVSQAKGTLVPLGFPDEVFDHYSIPAYDAGQSPAADRGASILSNKTEVPPGAILLSKLNPEIPRVWLTPEKGVARAICSTEFLPFCAKERIGRSFVYLLFLESGFRERLKGMVTGTSKSHQRVNPQSVLGMEVILPGTEVLEAFDALSGPMLSRVLSNREESHSLAQLRDLLLPQFMSGEIRLHEAEKLVGEGV